MTRYRLLDLNGKVVKQGTTSALTRYYIRFGDDGEQQNFELDHDQSQPACPWGDDEQPTYTYREMQR